MTDDFWDDLFLGCAFAAYVETWWQTGQFPPDSEATRRLAYRYYEEELAARNRRRAAVPAVLTAKVEAAMSGPPWLPAAPGNGWNEETRRDASERMRAYRQRRHARERSERYGITPSQDPEADSPSGADENSNADAE